MRKTISITLALLMALNLVPSAFGKDSVASQITAMPIGAKIELHLKNKQTMRGTRGQLSNAGFALVDASKQEHQIAFDDVGSVKRLTTKSHLARNVLILVGLGVVVLGVMALLIEAARHKAPF